MRIKLDENIDVRLTALLKEAGHDAITVREQGLRGIADRDLYDLCKAEGCILVTLDLDFSNLLHFPPEGTPGLVVVRGPNQLFVTMQVLMETLTDALVKESPSNKLWIVEPGRLRIHEE